jgi:hypothetical protein
MKHKIVQCLSRTEIETKDRWSYAWKQYVKDVVVVKYGLGLEEHRVPWFLSLHAHLRIEETLQDLASLVLPQFAFKPLIFPYVFLHGLICGYDMKEILRFWRCRT